MHIYATYGHTYLHRYACIYIHIAPMCTQEQKNLLCHKPLIQSMIIRYENYSSRTCILSVENVLWNIQLSAGNLQV